MSALGAGATVVGVVARFKDRFLGVRDANTIETSGVELSEVWFDSAARRRTQFGNKTSSPASNSDFDLDRFFSYNSPAASRKASLANDTPAPTLDPEPDYSGNEEAANSTEELSLEQKTNSQEAAGTNKSGNAEIMAEFKLIKPSIMDAHEKGLLGRDKPSLTKPKEPDSPTGNQDGVSWKADSNSNINRIMKGDYPPVSPISRP